MNLNSIPPSNASSITLALYWDGPTRDLNWDGDSIGAIELQIQSLNGNVSVVIPTDPSADSLIRACCFRHRLYGSMLIRPCIRLRIDQVKTMRFNIQYFEPGPSIGPFSLLSDFSFTNAQTIQKTNQLAIPHLPETIEPGGQYLIIVKTTRSRCQIKIKKQTKSIHQKIDLRKLAINECIGFLAYSLMGQQTLFAQMTKSPKGQQPLLKNHEDEAAHLTHFISREMLGFFRGKGKELARKVSDIYLKHRAQKNNFDEEAFRSECYKMMLVFLTPVKLANLMRRMTADDCENGVVPQKLWPLLNLSIKKTMKGL